jgi:myosin-crossreactive antigen
MQKTVRPAREARLKALSIERKLSDIVNSAYDLTAEEVELVWRTAPPRMPFSASDGG